MPDISKDFFQQGQTHSPPQDSNLSLQHPNSISQPILSTSIHNPVDSDKVSQQLPVNMEKDSDAVPLKSGYPLAGSGNPKHQQDPNLCKF